VRRQVREAGERRRWVYVLEAAQLADLGARYGGGVEGADEPESLGPSSSLESGDSGDKR
jgi:hypothetical protein